MNQKKNVIVRRHMKITRAIRLDPETNFEEIIKETIWSDQPQHEWFSIRGRCLMVTHLLTSRKWLVTNRCKLIRCYLLTGDRYLADAPSSSQPSAGKIRGWYTNGKSTDAPMFDRGIRAVPLQHQPLAKLNKPSISDDWCLVMFSMLDKPPLTIIMILRLSFHFVSGCWTFDAN